MRVILFLVLFSYTFLNASHGQPSAHLLAPKSIAPVLKKSTLSRRVRPITQASFDFAGRAPREQQMKPDLQKKTEEIVRMIALAHRPMWYRNEMPFNEVAARFYDSYHKNLDLDIVDLHDLGIQTALENHLRVLTDFIGTNSLIPKELASNLEVLLCYFPHLLDIHSHVRLYVRQAFMNAMLMRDDRFIISFVKRTTTSLTALKKTQTTEFGKERKSQAKALIFYWVQDSLVDIYNGDEFDFHEKAKLNWLVGDHAGLSLAEDPYDKTVQWRWAPKPFGITEQHVASSLSGSTLTPTFIAVLNAETNYNKAGWRVRKF